ncbi:MAG: radical SAM protein [Methanobacteriota archaeon]|nr:MAG: radical SAM protein [Euryarchaeota archaeon]
MTDSKIVLSSVHILLTYKCDSECDHCFVWSSPHAPGTMSIHQITEILKQATDLKSVNSVYFEGGEPFLFYPIMLKGIELAKQSGFDAGIVSNAYWAEDEDDARLWLKPLANLGVADLSLSADDYHGEDESDRRVANATRAAELLGIDVGVLRVKSVDGCAANDAGDVFFRGRAAVKLAEKVPFRGSSTLTSCPEEPPDIERVHIDAYGNVLFCQGISIGNINNRPLKAIIEQLTPERHEFIGPLARGGPAALAEELSIRVEEHYADACHMCYDIRCKLRAEGRFIEALQPDQSYGD